MSQRFKVNLGWASFSLFIAGCELRWCLSEACYVESAGLILVVVKEEESDVDEVHRGGFWKRKASCG